VADTRDQYADLARLYLPIAIAVFGVIALAVVAFLARYRSGRPGAPSTKHEHNALEIGYVVVLAAIAAGLVVATFHSESKEDALAAKPAVRVDVTAAKWRWSFAYPSLGVPSRPALVVPAGRTVRFSGRSLDVIHDFWVPDVRFQRQVFPDHVERWDLVFPHPGSYQGLCAWFCGLGHQDMRFEVRALAPAAFEAWVERSRR